MQLLMLWPLFFLILIPVIIILYLLKQKADDQLFSSLFLWKEAYKNIEATTPWERLKHNLLMYLQIITMLVLIITLAAPYLKIGGNDYRNIIIVIDNSGSMNYQYDNNNTRFEASIKKAIDYIDGINEGTQITIISNAKTAKIEIANTGDKAEAKNKLKSIQKTDLSGDLTSAISLVQSMINQMESYEMVIFTDEDVPLSEYNGYVVDMNSHGANASVDYVSHVIEENKMTVLVKITNQSNYNFNSDINLYIDDTLESVKNIQLEPYESKVMYFDEIEVASEVKGNIITAEINEKDYLLNDNKSYDLIRLNTVKNVLLITEQNIFLEKALLTKKNIELYKTNSVYNIDETDNFDIYIYDNIMPDKLPRECSIILINPETIEDILTVDEEPEGIRISAVKHDVTKYIENYTFGVNKLKGIKKPLWADNFLQAGVNNEYSAGFIGNYLGQTIAVLAFDVHQTDLPLQSEFPILINNILNSCLYSGLVYEGKFIAGDRVDINANPEGEDINIVSLNQENSYKEKITLLDNTNYINTELAGIFNISQNTEKGVHEESFVVNFPVSESKEKVSNNTNSSQNTQIIKAESIKGGMDLRNIFIVGIIILLIVEWIVYIKKI